jgi:hypothetical protein
VPVGAGQIEGVITCASIFPRCSGFLRVGLPPDARCGIHDDVVDTLGLGEHGHMA